MADKRSIFAKAKAFIKEMPEDRIYCWPGLAFLFGLKVNKEVQPSLELG
jgi:hypothetical protein